MSSPLDTLVVVVTASTAQLEKELNGLTAPNGPIGRLGSAATAVAATATAAFAAVGAAVAAVATKGIQAGTEFENHMTAAFRAVDGITDEMEADLTDGVRRIAQETGISADIVAEALASYAYAGMETAEALEILEIAAMGSVAAGTDLTETIGKLSGVEAGFRGQGVELIEVMDSLTTLSNNASGGFDAISSALVTVTPQANAAGVSLDEAGAAIGALTWLGVPASEAATQLRGALTELNDSSRGAGEQFKELVGVSFKEFIAAGGTFEEAIAAMNAGLQEQNAITGENITIGQLFGSTISGGAIEMLAAGEGAVFYTDILTSLEESTGSTSAGFEKMRGTVQSQNEAIGASMYEMLLVVSDHLLPIWSTLLSAVQDAMPAILDIVDTVFGGIAAAVNFIIDLFTNDLTGAVDESSTGITTAISGLWESLSGFFEAAYGFIETLADAVISILQPVFAGLQPFLEPIWNAVVGIVSAAYDLIAEIFTGLSLLWEHVLKPAWDLIAPFVEAVFGQIGAHLTAALEIISGVFNAIVSLIKGDFSGAWESIQGVVTAVVDYVQGTLERFAGLFGVTLDEVGEFIGGIVDTAGELITGWADGITAGIQTGISAIRNFAQNILDSILDFFGISSGDSSVFTELASSLIQGIINGLSAGVSNVVQVVQSVGESIWNSFKDFFGISSPSTLLAEAGQWLMDGIVVGLRSKLSGVMDSIRDVGSAIWNGFKDFFGISSPSRLMIEGGGYIAAGLAEGIEDGSDDAEAAAEAMSEKIKASLEALKAWTSTLTIEAEHSLRPLEDIRAELQATRDELEEQLLLLHANGEAGTEAFHAVAAEISAVDSALAGVTRRIDDNTKAVEDAAAKEAAARQAAADEAAVIEANKRKVAIEEGRISSKEQQKQLNEQLKALESAGKKYSNEWMSVYNEINSLREADLAAERAAQEAQKQLEEATYQHKRNIGLISDAEHLANLQQRLASESLTAQQRMQIEEEVLQLERQQNDERKQLEESLLQYKRLTGEVSTTEYLAMLKEQLAATEENTEEHIALMTEIYNVEQQLADDAQALADAVLAHKLATGELSTEGHIAYLKEQLDATEANTVEHLALQTEVFNLERQLADERKALEDEVFAYKLRTGEATLQDNVDRIKKLLENEELSASERIKLQNQLLDAEKAVNDEAAKSHQSKMDKVFAGIDGFRNILADLGVDANSAWGTVLDGAIGFAKAIASGDWIGAITSAISTVIKLLGDMSNGYKQSLEEIQKVQDTLLWSDAEAFGEWGRVSRGGILGFFGATKAHFKFDEIALDIARQLESGIAGGIKSGMKAFLSGESMSMIGAVSDSLRSSIEDAIIEGVISSAMMKTQLGSLIEDLTNAVMSGDASEIAKLEKQLDKAVAGTAGAIEAALNPVKNVLDRIFGSSGEPAQASSSSTAPVSSSSAKAPAPLVVSDTLERQLSNLTELIRNLINRISESIGAMETAATRPVDVSLNTVGAAAQPVNQTLNLYLDGRLIAQNTAQHLPAVLNLNGVAI